MNNSKKRDLAAQIRRFRARFVQSVGAVLGNVLPAKSLKQWIHEERGNYRERVYGPLRTLTLFIEQVLGADHSCQDAVARGWSDRVSREQTPCSLKRRGTAKRANGCPWGLLRVWGEKQAIRCAHNSRRNGAGGNGKLNSWMARRYPCPTRRPTKRASRKADRRKRGLDSRWHGWWPLCRCPAGLCSTGRSGHAKASRREKRQ